GAFDALPTVLRVTVNSLEQAAALRERFDVWEMRIADGYAIVGGSSGVQVQLLAEGFDAIPEPGRTQQVQESLRAIQSARAALCSAPRAPPQVPPDALPDGLPSAAEETGVEDQVASANIEATGAVPGIPGFACYRTATEIDDSLRSLAAAYPTLATLVDIGNSWEKQTPGGNAGSDLLALAITNKKSPGPKFPLVLMASIHARELATGEAALRFGEELLAGYGTNPEITWLLDHGVLHLMPMTNPDGREFAESGVLWRKNTHYNSACGAPISGGSFGVDLNRNFSYQWDGCSTSNCSSDFACSLTYRGSAPASEPETQAIESYLRKVLVDQRGPGANDAAPDDATGVYLSLHSYGELVLRPWGYSDALPPNSTGLKAVGDRYGDLTRYRSCQTGDPVCLYGADGTTDDWVYATFGIAAHTIEMGQNFFESCSTFESTILPSMRELFQYAFSIAKSPYQMAEGPVVESVIAGAAVHDPETTVESATVLELHAGQPLTLTAALANGTSERVDESSRARIGGAMWYLDAPPWQATVSGKFAALYGDFDGVQATAVAVIDTQGWAVGRHLLFVQATDAVGRAGAPSTIFVDLLPGLAARPGPPDEPPVEPPPKLPPADDFAPSPAFLYLPVAAGAQ
ncbi:MAG: M14 family zinc carboxypeptidase, partial [Caldilineaceae bacterium]